MVQTRSPPRRRALPLLLLAACLALLAPLLPTARADYYDLAEEALSYAYPSIRRVIGMYSYDDAPTFLGAPNVQPYIQLDLKFQRRPLPPATGNNEGDTFAPAPAPAPAPNPEAPAPAKTPAPASKPEVAPAPVPVAPAPKPVEDPAPAPKLAETPAPAPKPEKAPAPSTPAPAAPAATGSGKRRLLESEADQKLREKGKDLKNPDPVKPTPKDAPPDPERVKAKAAEEVAKAVREAAAEDPSAPRPIVESDVPRVQVLIMQDPTLTLSGIGHKESPADQLVDYCCTLDLFQRRIPGCNEVGTMIILPGTTHTLLSAYFHEDHPDTAFLEGEDGRYDVTTTGEHIIIAANCDSRLSDSTIVMTGAGIWKNPFGFLPGRLFGFLPFYFGMLLVYVAFTSVWVVLCFVHRKDVAGIQHCITTALLLTLAEVVAWYADYRGFNDNGVRHMGVVISAILLTSLRLTVSRMLVVAVAIGFPVVRPTLGLGTKLKIGILGLVYFLCEGGLEIVTRYSQTNETADRWRIFLSLPVAVLNAVFYWWIFTALHDLLLYLEQQKQNIKLAMYRTFTHMLAASLVAAVLFAVYQIYFQMTNQLALHWSLLWLLDGGFQLLQYSVIFLCIAWLWRPSSDSRRYAYAELTHSGGGGGGDTGPGHAGDDEDEFGSIELGEEPSTREDGHIMRAHITSDNAKFVVDGDDDEI